MDEVVVDEMDDRREGIVGVVQLVVDVGDVTVVGEHPVLMVVEVEVVVKVFVVENVGDVNE